MIAQSSCPCCGHAISDAEGLRWNAGTRTLSGRGQIAQIPPVRARIFDKLWRCWPVGHLVSLDEMTDYVYADDPNGGPESTNVISVQINHMKKQLDPFGISIKGRHGYLLYNMPRVAA